MRTQKLGQAITELGVGESDYTPAEPGPLARAVAGQALVQINVGFGARPSGWRESPTPSTAESRRLIRVRSSGEHPASRAKASGSAPCGRPPRGVKKEDFGRLDYFDVWVPDLAPGRRSSSRTLRAVEPASAGRI